jgi:7-keto-8-aminopelargonate synthetase-like enzyme
MHSTFPSFYDDIIHRNQRRTENHSQRYLPSHPASLSFSDNDYLGLSRHPSVLQSAAKAVQDFGTSACAARLLAGSSPIHRQLEKSLASWKSTEQALLFSAGYLTPLGVIPAIIGPQDTVVLERNAHSCLFDGAKLSGARLRIFNRQDTKELQKVLTSTSQLHPSGKILLVVESLHSMDGDWAPLLEIIQLKNQAGAWLLLDEAHANGTCGPAGAGLAAQLNCTHQIDIQMGTLGKTLGSSGGFVAASDFIINHLLNESRTFLFGTALSPMSAAAALASLDIVRSAEGDTLRQTLQQNIAQFTATYPSPLSGPIHFIGCRANSAALTASTFLRNLGIDVPAIRSPTVPEGTARLRLSFSSRHTPKDIQTLTSALSTLPIPSSS